MKKIAIVMNEVTIGGVDIALIEMLRRFDYDRYEVALWVGYGNGPLQEQIDPRVKIRYWGVEDSRALLCSQFIHGKVSQMARGIGYRILGRIFHTHPDRSTICSIRSLPLCTEEWYDCIICYQGISPVAIANALFRLRAKRYVLWIHGDLGRPSSDMAYMKHIYHRFDWAVAVSETAGKLFSEQYQYPPDRISVFHNIVDADAICRKADAGTALPLRHPAVVTVGRLSPEKGQTMVPEMMRMLLDRGYDAFWYLVGDGPSRLELEKKIQESGVADRVFLTGAMSNPYPYMKMADIYVQTSLTEGWCITVQEARILNKAIVTTPIPAILEQIENGKNGLVAEACREDALVECVIKLLEDSELREELTEMRNSCVSETDQEFERLYRILGSE